MQEKWRDVMRLYHGSPNKVIVPQYGLGEEKHDYGKCGACQRMGCLQTG